MTKRPQYVGQEVVLTGDSFLFKMEGLELHLINGDQFEGVATIVGRLREETYSQQLSGSGEILDLDGRDIYYDHLLLVESESKTIAGGARLQFVSYGTDEKELPNNYQSYLEQVYPGIKGLLVQQAHHLEIGRVALSSRFQRKPHSLMALVRGGLLIASNSGYNLLIGLVSYNHFKQSAEVNNAFLSAMMRPPYRKSIPGLPPPRHPIEGLYLNDIPHPITNVQSLELKIRKDLSENFRLPVLLRQYLNLMGAKVCNLSLARDFNQITEILMAADLRRMPRERLDYFTDIKHNPIYQRFSWYRGSD